MAPRCIGAIFLFCAAVAAARAEAELEIEVLTPPTPGCRQASNGDSLMVHYDGKLADGTRFDSSYERNQPLRVTLGRNQVVKGFETGLQGLCVGEVRMLTIPPHLGYGDRGAGGAIPGGATIKFKVEVVEITNSAEGKSEL
jgi:FKBP-type peptidyl-prolyl cis-trans isomerase